MSTEIPVEVAPPAEAAPPAGARTRRAFLTAFALMIALPLPVQVLGDFSRGDRIHAADVFREPATKESLRTYETEVAEKLRVAAPVRADYRLAWDRLASRGSTTVVHGDEGWLFYLPELRYLAAPDVHDAPARGPRPAGDPFDVIVDFHRQLASMGVPLIVALVPPKVAFEAEHLRAGSFQPGELLENVARAAYLQRLRNDGVNVVDLAEPLRAMKAAGLDPYRSDDTHWSPVAAVRAAQHVATRVRRLPGVAHLERTAFDHRRRELDPFGDLCVLLRPTDPRACPTSHVVLDQVVAAPDGRAPLDPASPVVVLGDSYSVMYSTDTGDHAGFPDQLAGALGMPVASFAFAGGGPDGSRVAFAQGGGIAEKKVVVWEVAERALFERPSWLKVDVIHAPKEPQGSKPR